VSRLLAAGVLTVAACGSARVVYRDRVGGVIQLGAGRDARDRAKARELMIDECGPGGGEIVSEGEEPIGARVWIGRIRTETAWRIRYECKAGL